MKIHKGEYKHNGKPVRWIETRTMWRFTLHQLIDGLCSHYVRNRTEGDDPLPESLTIHQITTAVREEYELHGTMNVPTWPEGQYAMSDDDARAWARGVILDVLPGLNDESES